MFAAGIYYRIPGSFGKHYVDHKIGLSFDECCEFLQMLAESYPTMAKEITEAILFLSPNNGTNFPCVIQDTEFRIEAGVDIWNGNCPDKCHWH